MPRTIRFVSLLYLLILVLSLAVVSCAATPPDFHACTELDMDRGFCIKAVSGKSGYVDDTKKIWDQVNDVEYSWWEIRPAMVMIPYFDYVELKKWIIQECKQTNQCDERISTWDRSLNNIDNVIKDKLGIDEKGRLP